MAIPKIQASVGKSGHNIPKDVEIIQKLINRSLRFLPGVSKLPEDKQIGPKTISAIEEFQKRIMGLANPDSTVDPGKSTLKQMWIHSIAEGILTKGLFHLEIQRKKSSTKSVTGNLLINGEEICHTLELPWFWNRKSASCVPFGEYNSTIRTDGTRGWRIQLGGVPGRSFVQIHIGNYPHQIEGCVLVGMGIGTDKLTNSGDAMKLLQVLFKKTGKPAIRVKITGAMQLPPEMTPPGMLGSKQMIA